MSENLLGRETSPYLLQHRDNPVHWRAWGEDAFAEARQANKPILLSVGYAACHWCHVMAHESFEDATTASLMNELFVNIKVDREERPDVDAIYQTALAMMGEQGGWPLTMFLTPKGEPFWGGTYFPPAPRYGRAAFRDILSGLADAWASKQEQVQKNVAALVGALSQRQASGPGQIDRDLLDQIALRLLDEVDTVNGGIGTAPKFPQPAIFELLWRGYKRSKNADFKQAVTLTLDRMSQGGIYDHLGGGYARYSTDAHWLAPHFEKMLYDNAQLIENLTLAWAETKSPLYGSRVAETVAWLQREMMAEGGAFAATLDADSEGVEGKFYVWDAGEIDALLGADAAVFKDAYDVRPEGNWEGHTILNRSRKMLLGSAAHEAKLAAARAVLFKEREKRIRPGRDDKVLGDWNGLMIAALARAGFAFDKPEWIELAQSAYDGVLKLLTAEDGRLRHSYRQGRRAHPATLDDHAQLARAGAMLFEVTGDPRFLERAETIVALADAHYWDGEAGGYFFTADDARDLITRTRHAHDNAAPSGNGTLAQVLARLHLHTGKSSYRDRASAVIGAFAGEVARNFFPLATLLNASELVEKPLQIVLVGDDAALARAVSAVSLPNLVLSRVTQGRELPRDHPAHGKGLVGAKPAAYVCEGPVCSAPFTDADLLAADLMQR